MGLDEHVRRTADLERGVAREGLVESEPGRVEVWQGPEETVAQVGRSRGHGQYGGEGSLASRATPLQLVMAPRQDFFERVWDVVREIPAGRVTTYGHIARHLGVGHAARTVGWALKAVATSDDLAVPCHRVVNREGALTGRMHFASPTLMEERLRSEDVGFTDDGRVELAAHLWVPVEPLP